MTVEGPPATAGVRPASSGAAGPSVHVVRARKLLWGGLLGGSVAAALCLIGFGIALGMRGLLSAALAAALVLVFYVGGQLVMVLFADAGARLLLAVSMASYTTRVVLVGLVLLLVNRHAGDLVTLAPTVVFLTTIAVVVGWLLVELWVFRRLRITAYDTEYVAPTGQESMP